MKHGITHRQFYGAQAHYTLIGTLPTPHRERLRTDQLDGFTPVGAGHHGDYRYVFVGNYFSLDDATFNLADLTLGMLEVVFNFNP